MTAGDTGKDQMSGSAAGSNSQETEDKLALQLQSRNGVDPFAGNSSSLSAEQIFRILQEQPESAVELKSMMATLAQEQGASLPVGGITDEMMYSKIASSQDLRRNTTTFLRARGYVSNDVNSDDMDRVSESTESARSNSPFSPGFGNDGLSSSRPEHSGGRSIFNGGDLLSYRPDGTSATQFGRDSGYRAATTLHQQPLTGSPELLHRPTPYNLLSLHDLYTQLPDDTTSLKRFGSDVFLRRNAGIGESASETTTNNLLDVPAGPDYVVGPGDSLTISLWGGISQNLNRTVDRDGHISLPDAGPLQIAGMSLSKAEEVITNALRSQYRNVQVAVTVTHLRTIRIYVVGDVQRPGAYEVNSLASSLNALYAAGGPTRVGSLRTLRHYRGKQLVDIIDLYDFLLHGMLQEDRLRAGDTLLVPPAGPQIAIYGAVKRPAIYELKTAEQPGFSREAASLAALLDDAGGVSVAAELTQIAVDRIDANSHRETISLDTPSNGNPTKLRAAIANFIVRDGDRIHVSRILPFSERVVYMEGHVVRPGRKPYREGMHLSDLLQSYRDLLPEPADNAEIVRLVLPDLHPETLDFSVLEALIGNNDIALQPYDTIRIYGRYEADAPRVTVGGEVLRPGTYSLSAAMTASQLVRMAGGFKRDALLTSADLTSYTIANGSKITSERTSLRIGDAVLRADHSADVPLKPGDVLTVHQITGWDDIGSAIRVEGEVAHPGSYGIQQGERLSSILRRAGGFRETSYPEGAILLRDEVRVFEEKSREELIRQIETSSAAARIRPNLGSGDQSSTLQLIAAQQQEVVSRLKRQPPSGRLVIHVTSDLAAWENTSADIEVRAGDVLRIPKRPGFVLVSGQVYNSSAITFAPDKTATWYLRRSGGPTEMANRRDIFIIRANGSVVGRHSGSWPDHDVMSAKMEPGDVLVVPQKILGTSVFWRNLLTVAQVSSSVAITAAVAGLL